MPIEPMMKHRDDDEPRDSDERSKEDWKMKNNNVIINLKSLFKVKFIHNIVRIPYNGVAVLVLFRFQVTYIFDIAVKRLVHVIIIRQIESAVLA